MPAQLKPAMVSVVDDTVGALLGGALEVVAVSEAAAESVEYGECVTREDVVGCAVFVGVCEIMVAVANDVAELDEVTKAVGGAVRVCAVRVADDVADEVAEDDAEAVAESVLTEGGGRSNVAVDDAVAEAVAAAVSDGSTSP